MYTYNMRDAVTMRANQNPSAQIDRPVGGRAVRRGITGRL